MACAEYLKPFPLSQRIRRRQCPPPSIYLRSSGICTVCAVRQQWWQQRQHLDVRRVTNGSTAKSAQRATGYATNILGPRAISTFTTQSASSRKGDPTQAGAIEGEASKKVISLGKPSTSTHFTASWHSPSLSTGSSSLFICNQSSHRWSSSQRRALSSRQASKNSSAAAPVPTTPPNAADIMNTENSATSPAIAVESSASQLRKLYNALKQLGKSGAASAHVDMSRLNLAIKGVEDSLRRTDETIAASSGPVVRIAVLSLSSQQLTRRLVRLLLADPLSKEEEWEKQLDSAEKDDGRAILLRYGERPTLSLHNRLLYNFTIPSLFLQKNNLEILIHTLDTTSADHQITGKMATNNILKPALLAPSLATDRQTAISFPVHTTLIVGEGLESCITFGRLSAGQRQSSPLAERIKFVMLGTSNAVADTLAASDNSSHQRLDKDKSMDAEYAQVDVQQAAKALSLFRKTAANSTIYEQSWHQARMPQLMDWIRSQCADSTNASPGKEILKPAVRTLVSSILTDAHVSIGKAQTQLQESKDAMLIPYATKQAFNKALDTWAEFAHKELRDKLNNAFNSRAWRDLSWWKLVWKAEDVGRVSFDILTHEWLVSAEQEIIYLCGRMEEAGYRFLDSDGDEEEDGNNYENGASNSVDGEQHSVPPQYDQALEYQKPSLPPSQAISNGTQVRNDPPHAQADAGDAYPSDAVEERISLVSGAGPPAPLVDGPWPSPILDARFDLIYSTVPPFHRQAQMLFIKYLFSISGSLMLGGLLSGASSIGPYEAGSVALVGSVWGVRRFQKSWNAVRSEWEENVREVGRGAVREIEGMVREILGEQKKKRTTGLEDNKRDEVDFEAKLLAEVSRPAEKALRALEKTQ